MLNKNLVKNGFFSYLLLLFVPNVTAVRGETLTHFKGVPEERLQKSDFNSTDSLGSPTVVDSSSTVAVKPAEKVALAAPEVALNKQASKFVKSFLKKEDESLSRVKQRSKYYFTLIDTIFTKYGLPLELKYLAVIESDLKTSAVSRVGAKGMWQFMAGTARDLGLKVSKKYDERTHAYKSTVAAAKYLKDLYAYYGDWLLVLAAYNGGPVTVDKAIRRAGSRNFWALQSFLPEESRGHVKRFIGTHYYFEGKGSITTLTKAEGMAYKKALAEFKILAETEEQKENVVADIAANR